MCSGTLGKVSFIMTQHSPTAESATVGFRVSLWSKQRQTSAGRPSALTHVGPRVGLAVGRPRRSVLGPPAAASGSIFVLSLPPITLIVYSSFLFDAEIAIFSGHKPPNQTQKVGLSGCAPFPRLILISWRVLSIKEPSMKLDRVTVRLHWH